MCGKTRGREKERVKREKRERREVTATNSCTNSLYQQRPVCLPHLVPSHKQLGIRVLEEATDVRPHKLQSGNTQRQQHGNGDLEVLPVCCVVPSPYCTCTRMGVWNSIHTCQHTDTIHNRPNLWEPAKKALDSTKGLSCLPDLSSWPSAVASCW